MKTFIVKQSKRPVFWLILASTALLLSNGRFAIGIFAWLAPALMLRFTRMTQKPVRHFLLAGLISMVVCAVAWLGIVPFMGPPFLGFILYSALFARLPYAVLPFVADRLLVRRDSPFLSTLVLPLTAIAGEFLGGLVMGTSWGALAYTLAGDTLLAQLLSVTGMPGITFIIYWFAAVINWAAEQGFNRRQARIGIVTYAMVFCLVFVYGGIRIAQAFEGTKVMRVASIVANTANTFSTEDQLLFSKVLTGQDYSENALADLRTRLGERHDRLFTLSEEAISSGADLVLWAEGSAIVFNEAEREAILARAADLARRANVYIAVGITRVSTDPQAARGNNGLALIDPSGAVRWQYTKSQLIPYVEEPYFQRGNGTLPVTETEFGRIGGVICYDMDAPGYLQQAGATGVDLLLAPANDYPGSARIHLSMAAFRAIEQGFSMVRAADNGVSSVVNHRGQVLDELDHLRTGDQLLVSELPITRVTTIYSQIGDSFLWAGLAGLVAIVPWSLARNLKRRSLQEAPAQQVPL